MYVYFGEVEYLGIIEYIKCFKFKLILFYIVECEIKNFVDMVLERMMWFLLRYWNCIFMLKIGFIDKFICKVCVERKIRIVYNCIGLCLVESVFCSKCSFFFINFWLIFKSGKCVVYDFLFIFYYLKLEIFEVIF